MADIRVVAAAVLGLYGGVESAVKVVAAAVLGGTPAGRVRIVDAAVMTSPPSVGAATVKIVAAKVLNGGYDPSVVGVVRLMRAAVVGVPTGSGIVRITRAAVVSESTAPSHRRLYVMVGTSPVAARYGTVISGSPVYF